MLKALIFDMAGTLADTEEANRRAFNAAFQELGFHWQWDVPTFRRLRAAGGDDACVHHYVETEHPHLFKAYDTDFLCGLIRKSKDYRYQQMLASGAIRLRPGILRVLTQARAAGIRLGIASSSPRRHIDTLLVANGADSEWLDVIGSAETAVEKKPAPDLHRWVAQGLAVTPDECLAIEDSQPGFDAVCGAGMPAVITTSAYTADQAFDGALAVLPHLGDPEEPLHDSRTLGLPRPWVDLEQLKGWHLGHRAASAVAE
jgi:HAD superfamily hydrolase (TIGR01509 family)